MTSAQHDLLAVVYNKNMKPDYTTIQSYAAQYRKYNHLTMRQIDEVVKALCMIYQNEKHDND